ncbi:MAG TPA: hypothetical protein VJ785_15145, partial [Anaerolineales bacterium]|nr:hypothetical protein [Anaerolineales bacterium]
MRRRYKERRYRRNRRDDYRRRGISLTSMFRTPRSQIAVLAVVALFIILLLLNSRTNSSTPTSLPPEITVSEAFTKYQNGAFVLDVRTQEEWDEYHAPNT